MSDLESHDDLVDHAIRALLRVMVTHPIATQAAYSALVREGRAFAETEDGRRLRDRLARSDLAARLRTAWEVTSFGMFRAESAPGTLPSVLVEAIVQAVSRMRFEARLLEALDERGSGEHESPAT